MAPITSSGSKACRQSLEAFFSEYPNVRLKADAERVLEALESADLLVYAVGSTICGVPGVLNAELEEAFGVSMSTVRRRAAAVRREIPWAWPTHRDAGYGDGLPLYGS